MSQRGMYTADFETNTHSYDVSVWAYAICDIKNVENVVYGNCMQDAASIFSISSRLHKCM